MLRAAAQLADERPARLTAAERLARQEEPGLAPADSPHRLALAPQAQPQSQSQPQEIWTD